MSRRVLKRIPAGKYEGQYRSALGERGGRNHTHNHGQYNMRHVVCGHCYNRYEAYKTACDNCGGV